MTPILVRGRGARVEDLDGNWFVEYGMGLRSITLGHALRARRGRRPQRGCRRGQLLSAQCLGLRAAEDFLAQVPGADMVKFAKNGSDTTTAAIRLARAVTGRDLVAICGTQPFFSGNDWFIASTQMKAGIPSAYGSMTVKFNYNDLASLYALYDAYPDQIAAVILEAATATAEPAAGFLESLRAVTQQHGTVLIFDEMITGMRWSRHGAQGVYGVRPTSRPGEGHRQRVAVSALAGKREFMEAGGLNTDGPGSSSCRPRTAPRLLAWPPILPCLLHTHNATWSPRWRFKAQSCARDWSRSPRRPACRRCLLPRPSLVSGVCDQGSQRPAVSGFPHPFHPGVAATGSARSVLGDLRRPHGR